MTSADVVTPAVIDATSGIPISAVNVLETPMVEAAGPSEIQISGQETFYREESGYRHVQLIV